MASNLNPSRLIKPQTSADWRLLVLIMLAWDIVTLSIIWAANR
jgi:hypothetical protein